MRHLTIMLAVVAIGFSTAAPCADMPLSSAQRAAAFKAAGFKPSGSGWVACAEGQISEVRDINGDGRPEVIITETGKACHGMAGEGFSLLSLQPDGRWTLMAAATGMPIFLSTRGVGGWPDLQVGGPGFCFPVLRWNGRAYALQRHEYEGKRCTA